MQLVNVMADVRTLAVRGRLARLSGDWPSLPDGYFEQSKEDRREIYNILTDAESRQLEGRVTEFLVRFLNSRDMKDFWMGMICLELSASRSDWRDNLVKLLILDHVLVDLKLVSDDEFLKVWKSTSPGTYKNYMQLDDRDDELRNLASVDLKEVVKSGKKDIVYDSSQEPAFMRRKKPRD